MMLYIILTIIGLAGLIYSGWIVTYLWDWLIVANASADPIGIVQGVCIYFVLRGLSGSVDGQWIDDIAEKENNPRVFKRKLIAGLIGREIAGPTVILLVVYLILWVFA